MINTKFAHVCINTIDLNKSINFYENILGFTKKFFFKKKDKYIGVYLEICSGNYIEIFLKEDNKVINTGITHFCIEVNNIDELIEKLKQNKINFSDKTLGADQSYQIWLTDPDGNKIEIHQYTQNSSQLTGKDVEIN